MKLFVNSPNSTAQLRGALEHSSKIHSQAGSVYRLRRSCRLLRSECESKSGNSENVNESKPVSRVWAGLGSEANDFEGRRVWLLQGRCSGILSRGNDFIVPKKLPG